MRRVFSIVILVSFSLCSLASAEDKYVRVNGPAAKVVNNALPVAETGKALYDTQEGAHAAVTATTGESIDHYYVNVCTEDECVPVDPFRVKN